MLGRELHRSRAENRIDARRENGDRGSGGADRAAQIEIDERAFAAADPVPLHDANFFRPASELVEVAQQFVSVFRDAQEPLFQLALLDERIFVAPAIATDHLFVGEHGSALRAPVDLALLAIGKAHLIELQEEPLVPAIVVGEAGGHFARPVVAEAEALHLRLHVGDVRERPLARRRIVLDGRVLRGQAERVPAHGMQHVVAIHPHVTSKRVADRVVPHVPHVQRAGWIRQHLEHVVLRHARVGLGGVERRVLLPALGPLHLDTLGVVALIVGTFCAGRHGFCFCFLRHKRWSTGQGNRLFYNGARERRAGATFRSIRPY